MDIIRFFWFISFLMLWSCTAQGQAKRALEVSDFGRWTELSDPSISGDGRHVLYRKQNVDRSMEELWLVGSKNGHSRHFDGAKTGFFTTDSRKLLIQNKADSLLVFELLKGPNDTGTFLTKSSVYERCSGKYGDYLLVFDAERTKLAVFDLLSGKRHTISGVSKYWKNEQCGQLLLNRKTGEACGLFLTSLTDFSEKEIWSGQSAREVIFDAKRGNLAFLGKRSGDTLDGVWSYRKSATGAELAASQTDLGLADGQVVNSLLRFGGRGDLLFMKCGDKVPPVLGKRPLGVDVWSYLDAKIQNEQQYDLSNLHPVQLGYVAVLELGKAKAAAKRLQEEGETLLELSNEYGLVASSDGGSFGESHWNIKSVRKHYLLHYRSGNRDAIEEGFGIAVSPSGKHMLALQRRGDIFSYVAGKGKRKNLTSGLGQIPGNRDQEYNACYLELSGWLSDTDILVNDGYDYWILDIFGKRKRIALTAGEGRSQGIRLSLLGKEADWRARFEGVEQSDWLFCALDERSWQNGFYRVSGFQGGKAGSLEKLSMGDHFYGFPVTAYPLPNGMLPVRAAEASVWLVQRQSASSSPNYFLTEDFKSFRSLSDNHPESSVSWLKSRLIDFLSLDGYAAKAAVYLPENFDPGRKYPVVLHYYEKLSQQVNGYEKAVPMAYYLNIPWMVSRGYVVVTPDIQYVQGFPGRSAHHAIMGLRKCLLSLPWVDSTKIGLMGHSFGGFQTNYLVSHTPVFAAAVASSGASDMLSNYSSILRGASNQSMHETGQYRMGGTPWSMLENYLENSPVLRADQVETPLLLMNNLGDRAVSFGQGAEFFLALRRLGKRAWMLQYDRGGHVLSNPEDMVQHTLRITQFFDHYLKCLPAPKWMTRGVPASMKESYDGMELDMEIVTPGKGLLNEN